jgi:predicted RNA-binding Zn-ribbon protein involved in translation (DUF1610 family)
MAATNQLRQAQVRMASSLPPTLVSGQCQKCGNATVARLTEASSITSAPSYHCSTCGTELLAHIGTRSLLATVVLVLLAMAVAYAVFIWSASLSGVSGMARFVGLLAVLGAVFGLCASRLRKATKFKLRPPQ